MASLDPSPIPSTPLQAGSRPEIDAVLAGVPPERKREALEVLRQLTAVVRPEMYVSHSQVGEVEAR